MEHLYHQPVDVADMMAARDARAARQRLWRMTYKSAIIGLGMNVAGPVKVTGVIAQGFAEAVARVEAQLARYGFLVLAAERFLQRTGLEAMWAVDADAAYLKRRLADIEERDALGRLMDIDVLSAEGKQIARTDIGLPARRCLLCAEAAAACARSRRHGVDALFARTEAIITEALDARFADGVASLAQRALLFEVAVTPKPGLVDRDNAGAHADMDIYSFLASASVLPAYFRDCARIGLEHANPAEAFAALRYPGMCAEDDMHLATGGVNTHKGAIFSLGILCGAAGLLRRAEKPLTPAALCGMAGTMTREALLPEMARIKGPKGARGEAAAGFPSVLRVGLPAFTQRRSQGESLENAAVYALVSLMAQVLDANVARRAGEARARALMQEAAAQLDGFSPARVARWDGALTAERISPGGCADLLAATLFVHFLSACP